MPNGVAPADQPQSLAKAKSAASGWTIQSIVLGLLVGALALWFIGDCAYRAVRAAEGRQWSVPAPGSGAVARGVATGAIPGPGRGYRTPLTLQEADGVRRRYYCSPYVNIQLCFGRIAGGEPALLEGPLEVTYFVVPAAERPRQRMILSIRSRRGELLPEADRLRQLRQDALLEDKRRADDARFNGAMALAGAAAFLVLVWRAFRRPPPSAREGQR